MPETFNVWTAVVPHNTTDLAVRSEALYVGGVGDVAAVMQDGAVAVFVGVPAGSILPIICRRVNATGTSATGILSLRQI